MLSDRMRLWPHAAVGARGKHHVRVQRSPRDSHIASHRAITLLRRSISLLTLGLIVGTTAAWTTPSSTPGRANASVPSSQWPQVGYGPAQVWFNPHETTVAVGNVARVVPKYSVAMLTSRVSADVIGGGRRFFSGLDDGVRALDAATGAPLWSVDVDACNLAYDGGVLFAVQDYPTYGITAYDATTGARRWEIHGIAGCWSIDMQTLLVRNGVIYLIRKYEAGPYWMETQLFAVDEQTGVLRWSLWSEDGRPLDFGMATTASALVTSTVRTGLGRYARIAVRNPLTGALLWTKTLPASGTISAISIQANVAYVTVTGASSSIVAIDLATHRVRFQITAAPGSVFGTAAFAYQRMYVNDGNNGIVRGER